MWYNPFGVTQEVAMACGKKGVLVPSCRDCRGEGGNRMLHPIDASVPPEPEDA